MNYTDPRLSRMSDLEIRQALHAERITLTRILIDKKQLRNQLDAHIADIEQRLGDIEQSENAL